LVSPLDDTFNGSIVWSFLDFKTHKPLAGLGTEAPGFTADRKRDIMWGFYAHENYKKKKKESKVPLSKI
jgi:hypothetical protein